MTKPTIAFVPGLWEGPSVFSHVSSLLSTYNYTSTTIPLQSTGHASPNNPNLKDDVKGIRGALIPLIEGNGSEEGKEIILVGHSAGAFLAANAVEGMGLETRKRDGKRGGVKRLVFLTGGIWPEGMMHPDLPFFEKVVSPKFFFLLFRFYF